MGYHSKYVGFSSGLMATLKECRGQVESWAEREKRAADVMEEEYQQDLKKEQAIIDSLEQKLLNIRLKLGINAVQEEGVRRVGGDGPDAGGSIVQKQQELLREKARVEAEISELKREKEEKSEEIERK